MPHAFGTRSACPNRGGHWKRKQVSSIGISADDSFLKKDMEVDRAKPIPADCVVHPV
jgi:hypothetical protein